MLEVNFLGHRFKNPLIAASGTFGFGEEFEPYFDPGILGGIATKGLTLEPRNGNPGTRIYETPMGIMNSIGLQNPGVEAFVEREYPRMKKYDTEILANVGGSTLETYKRAVEKINETDIPFIELNISCPNVKAGGMAFGIQCQSAEMIVSEIRKMTDKKLIVKLSPNAENIVEMAKTCEAAGADALSLVNTFQAMAIDVKRRAFVFANKTAGLSGPAIRPIALRMVYDVAHVVEIPVIGMGGISTAEDVLMFLMAGAKLVEIGTANFIEPRIMPRIIEDLEQYIKKEELSSIEDIIGIL